MNTAPGEEQKVLAMPENPPLEQLSLPKVRRGRLSSLGSRVVSHRKFDAHRIAEKGARTDVYVRHRDIDGYSGALGRTFQRLLDSSAELAEQRGETLRICDVGCGKGNAFLGGGKPRGAIVSAVDLWPEQCGTPHAEYDPSRSYNLLRGSIDRLPLPTDSHHLVAAAYVHNYAADPLRAIKEMLRVAVPRGVVAFNIAERTPIVFRSPSGEVLFLRMIEFMRFLRREGHDVDFSLAPQFFEDFKSKPIVIRKNRRTFGIRARFLGTRSFEEISRCRGRLGKPLNCGRGYVFWRSHYTSERISEYAVSQHLFSEMRPFGNFSVYNAPAAYFGPGEWNRFTSVRPKPSPAVDSPQKPPYVPGLLEKIRKAIKMLTAKAAG